MTMKIQLKRLVEKYLTLESANSRMDQVVEYLTAKHIKFNGHMREEFAKFIEKDAELYDNMFDYIGDFADLDKVVTDEAYADQVFNAIPEDYRERFKDIKPISSEGALEPSYKFIDVKEQLPPDTRPPVCTCIAD